MSLLPLIDILVLLAYLAGVVGLGCWFVRKSRSTDEFMAAGRSLPGWAVGLSIYGTYVSSISFLANPGKSYVQRYITARDDRAAARSVWIGTLLYVPISAVLFFIGTGLFAFYTTQPELITESIGAAARPDAVFPHFIVSQLPTGMTGPLEPLRCPFHSFMTIAIGTLTILLVGLLASGTPSRGDQAA